MNFELSVKNCRIKIGGISIKPWFLIYIHRNENRREYMCVHVPLLCPLREAETNETLKQPDIGS